MGEKIKAPKYIPAKIMRAFTREQLRVIATQRNTKGLYSQNAYNAQKILWYTSGHTSMETGITVPLSMHEATGWNVAEAETVSLEPWLNGTEEYRRAEQ